MEEEAPSRRSVAELAGRFKGSAPPHDAAGNETQEKPVRRRPPRSLQIPKPQVDEQEPSPDAASLPTTAKRNSALIEKLQAQLVLSPTAKVPSPKSPGFRLLPPAFTPPSPGSTPLTTSSKTTPTSPVTSSPVTEEERPVSFEDPVNAAEGSILSSINKSRARHSLRRRPPSRRHRMSSSGDEVGAVNDAVDATLSSVDQPGDKTTEGGGGGEDGGEKEVGGEVFEKEAKTDEVKEDKTDTSTCPEQSKDQSMTEPRGEDEEEQDREDRPTGGEDGSSSERKEEEEEKKSGETLKEVSSEEVINTDAKEEEKSEESSQCLAR